MCRISHRLIFFFCFILSLKDWQKRVGVGIKIDIWFIPHMAAFTKDEPPESWRLETQTWSAIRATGTQWHVLLLAASWGLYWQEAGIRNRRIGLMDAFLIIMSSFAINIIIWILISNWEFVLVVENTDDIPLLWISSWEVYPRWILLAKSRTFNVCNSVHDFPFFYEGCFTV